MRVYKYAQWSARPLFRGYSGNAGIYFVLSKEPLQNPADSNLKCNTHQLEGTSKNRHFQRRIGGSSLNYVDLPIF